MKRVLNLIVYVLICSVVLGVSLAVFAEPVGSAFEDDNFCVEGIDVSSWQGVIDWEAVKNSGINFAMLRCGFGRKTEERNQVDNTFLANVKGAQAVGLDTGVYHYSYAISPEDAINEANFCLEIIKDYKFTYPIVFDIEDDSMKHLGKRVLTDICKAFCSTIEKNGYYTAIYCNPDWLKNYLYADELLPRYDLWLAHWYVEKPSYKCGLWQYTKKGSVLGIKGNVDRDFCYKDYPYIIKDRHFNGF